MGMSIIQYTKAIAGHEHPSYMQIQLGQFRELVQDATNPMVIDFLDKVKAIPAQAIVVIANGELSLLVDDEGELLAFAGDTDEPKGQ